jgi:hypothetical protein
MPCAIKTTSVKKIRNRTSDQSAFTPVYPASIKAAAQWFREGAPGDMD